MTTQYVVSSPSRTGSTLLCYILASGGVTNILHTHNCSFSVENPMSTVLIFSARRDLFRSIMSCLIGKRTSIFNYVDKTYQAPKIEPFAIDCNSSDSEFVLQYNWHKWHIQSHDLTKSYSRIETLYLEDFVNDYQYVYDKFGLIQKQQKIITSVESSYKYQDLIINHQQCKEIFDQLETTSTFIPILKPYDPELAN
jgi:hypothetical protein